MSIDRKYLWIAGGVLVILLALVVWGHQRAKAKAMSSYSVVRMSLGMTEPDEGPIPRRDPIPSFETPPMIYQPLPPLPEPAERPDEPPVVVQKPDWRPEFWEQWQRR